MKMICDGPDPAKLANRLQFIKKFGRAKLFEFDNPWFGLSQAQFDDHVDNLFPIKPSGPVHEIFSPLHVQDPASSRQQQNFPDN